MVLLPTMDYDFKVAISDILREQGITKKQLAEKAAIGYYNLSFLPVNWNPSLRTLFSIIDALDVTSDSFLLRCGGQQVLLKRSGKDHSDYVAVINRIFGCMLVRNKSTFQHLNKLCTERDLSMQQLFEDIEANCKWRKD